MKKYFLTLLMVGLLSACGSSKKVGDTASNAVDAATENSNEEETESVTLEELQVLAAKDLGPYRASEKRVNDLLHTELKVRFDWDKRYLYGQAMLDFTPYFYPTNVLTLDAKGFDLKEVAMVKNGSKQAVKYEYDNQFITIDLGREYKAGEKYQIFVDYTAKPYELEDAMGSDAITEDRGLYFINHDGTTDQPQQIWTQGETEASSCWFPTIDAPNEKTTQEMFITVQDRYITLSNGKLMGSTKNSDGTRTDNWKQGTAHTPYLFMMTVGEFEVTEDSWRGIPVNYYMEKGFGQYAKEIFGNTPEMMDFYSKILDYDYPWDKYAQVVVREFVSGAMENTSAVVFFDGMNQTTRERLDEDHEDIVAHELFHHWFGDIVTCESWSNLPMNESFATYGEFLWIEHKYGDDEAANHLRIDLRNYLAEAEEEKKVLIRHYYDDKEDMFDAHSYQKGGRVLHMLRNYLGDDAFFKSLNVYLKDNEFQTVEVHQLRLAMEEVCGEDLNWFFDQWFFGSGHPILDINYEYDQAFGKSIVSIKQTQPEPVFELPMAIDLYVDGKVQREMVIMTDREQTFTFKANKKPDLVNVDADKMLLCEKVDNKSPDTWAYQYKNAPKFIDRYEAVWAMKEMQDNANVQQAMLDALKDPFWAVRARTCMHLDLENATMKEKTLPILKDLAINDKESITRSSAIEALVTIDDPSLKEIYKKAMNDQSYMVMGSALAALTSVDNEMGLAEAQKLEGEESGEIIRAIAEIYGGNGDDSQIAFFDKKLADSKGYTKYVLLEQYAALLARSNDNKAIEKGAGSMADAALNDNTWWVRMSAGRSLYSLMMHLKEKSKEGEEPNTELDEVVAGIQKNMDAIKAKESHPRLKVLYSMME